MTIELPYRYDPRPYQIPAWRAMDDYKRVLMVWHRRAGKDKLCLNKLVARAAETKAGRMAKDTAPPPADPPAGKPANIKSDADYNALPSGATFVGPDGKTRRKP